MKSKLIKKNRERSINSFPYQVGWGFDVHKFTKKKKNLVLGGVKIKFPLGFEAVSDGDVVLHAVCDGLLGAACLGDIGDYFLPGSPKSKNIKSIVIVRKVLTKISKEYEIANIDITVVLEKPRLVRYKKEMLDSLRNIFDIDRVNIKIKSKEGLDILCGVNAVACFAAVLLRRIGNVKNKRN
ncbi:MAG: 2-C-methyl-D-erythritol 2,4-cyclodiphosphate synthase [Candidatus Omnitrophica bacterium]|nr:2-C-methyl-D-erythritol 2,4-cyclodiphosphate synthase [Candidatus Omnitrophota bacterium]